jgi:speckle-type POZ protein
MLLGNPWRLSIYPGGSANAVEGMVTLYLENGSNKSIDIDYGFSIIDGNGKQVEFKRSDGPRNFAPVGTTNSARGFPNFVLRSDLMRSLVNGTLIMEIRMKLATLTKSVPPSFIPENPSLCKTIQGVFMKEKYSDIVFEVGESHGRDNVMMKVAKTVRETFPAHRVIVACCSSIFADLYESQDDGTTPIQINDVTPDVFRLMLSYIYGGKVSENDIKSHAREIIDAADKYGVVNLKLESEACLVEGTTFTIENVKEILIYAESKNCALLKEAAMDYVVANKADVIKKLSFNDAPGTLLNDMLTAFVRSETESRAPAGGNDENDISSMRVSELRRKAHEKGLNVDGSREMLIATLKAVQEAEVESEEDSEESDEEPEEA